MLEEFSEKNVGQNKMVTEYYLETVDLYMNRIINEIEINMNFCKPQVQMLKSLLTLTSYVSHRKSV